MFLCFNLILSFFVSLCCVVCFDDLLFFASTCFVASTFYALGNVFFIVFCFCIIMFCVCVFMSYMCVFWC